MVGQPDRSTDVHKDVHADLPLGISPLDGRRSSLKSNLVPVDRAVDRLQVPHSRVGAVDQTVDREAWHGRLAREQLLSGIETVDRAVDRQAQRSLF